MATCNYIELQLNDQVKETGFYDLLLDKVGVFLFQAKDGIRDLVMSRGLGDVYKRQRRRSSRQRAARSYRRPEPQAGPA